MRFFSLRLKHHRVTSTFITYSCNSKKLISHHNPPNAEGQDDDKKAKEILSSDVRLRSRDYC